MTERFTSAKPPQGPPTAVSNPTNPSAFRSRRSAPREVVTVSRLLDGPLVGIGFLFGGAGLAVTGAAAVVADVPTLLDPPASIGLGVVYIALGYGWLWTVLQERRTEKHYQQMREAFDELEVGVDE
jgi:Flp pilus assembly protein TadB